MDEKTRKLVAWGAILAPSLHTFTDLIEWAQGGFTSVQLWLNYVAFVPIPAVLLGLYAVQRPRISLLGLIGALVYGFAFVYFAFSTMFALASGAGDYGLMWDKLGWAYTLHGGLMVIGGGVFGISTLRAGVLPSWTARLFLVGLAANLVAALLPVPDLTQIIGSCIRNAGLVCMGWMLVNRDKINFVT